jgi:hypothetical protein
MRCRNHGQDSPETYLVLLRLRSKVMARICMTGVSSLPRGEGHSAPIASIENKSLKHDAFAAASLITRLFSSSPLVRSRCMRAATSSRSQFLASVCIREPRDGQGVRDAMRGGLRVAQLGFCPSPACCLWTLCTISTGRISELHPAPNGLR